MKNIKIPYKFREKLGIILGTSFSFQKCLLDPSGPRKKNFLTKIPFLGKAIGNFQNNDLL